MKNTILFIIIALHSFACVAQYDTSGTVFYHCDCEISKFTSSLGSTYNYDECKNFKNKDNILSLRLEYKHCEDKDYYNQLKSFKNIESVDFVGDFEELPEQIFSCNKITHVTFHFNNSFGFDRLFLDVSKLENIKTVKISFSYIGIFPESIKELKKIENLDVRFSHISGFGSGFKELINLKTLRLTSCNLCYLPDGYSNTNLKCLDISSNDFDELPKEIIDFPNLESLRFFNNFLKVEDIEVLCNLKKLKFVALGNIDIDSIPEQILCIKSLEFLTLTNTIQNIDNILKFSQLKVIDFADFKGDRKQLEEIEKMINTFIYRFPKIIIKK